MDQGPPGAFSCSQVYDGKFLEPNIYLNEVNYKDAKAHLHMCFEAIRVEFLDEEPETRSLFWNTNLIPQEHVSPLWAWLLNVFLQDCGWRLEGNRQASHHTMTSDTPNSCGVNSLKGMIKKVMMRGCWWGSAEQKWWPVVGAVCKLILIAVGDYLLCW